MMAGALSFGYRLCPFEKIAVHNHEKQAVNSNLHLRFTGELSIFLKTVSSLTA